MSELSDRLKALAEKAAAGTLTDEDRVTLDELGKAEAAKIAPQRLGELAKEAEKETGLSPQARRELAEIGADVSKGLLARHSFEQLSQTARHAVHKSGIKLVDAAPLVEKRKLGEKEIRRSHFEAMSQLERMKTSLQGMAVVDDELIAA